MYFWLMFSISTCSWTTSVCSPSEPLLRFSLSISRVWLFFSSSIWLSYLAQKDAGREAGKSLLQSDLTTSEDAALLNVRVCERNPEVRQFFEQFITEHEETLICTVQYGSSLSSICGKNPEVCRFKWRLTNSAFQQHWLTEWPRHLITRSYVRQQTGT